MEGDMGVDRAVSSDDRFMLNFKKNGAMGISPGEPMEWQGRKNQKSWMQPSAGVAARKRRSAKEIVLLFRE